MLELEATVARERQAAAAKDLERSEVRGLGDSERERWGAGRAGKEGKGRGRGGYVERCAALQFLSFAIFLPRDLGGGGVLSLCLAVVV